MDRRHERLTGPTGGPSGRQAFPPPPVNPTPPAEPEHLKLLWRAAAEADPEGTRRRLADPSAAGDIETIADWLWSSWATEWKTAGVDRATLDSAAVGLALETWLWLVGERVWDELAGLYYGRAVRLARQRSGATSTNG